MNIDLSNSSIKGLISQGNAAANGAIAQYENALGSAKSGLQSVLDGGSTIQADLSTARNAAAGMSDSISAVKDSAAAAKQEAYNLQPYAQKMSGYGDVLFGSAQDTLSSGNNILDIAKSLLNLESGSGGVSDEYINLYNALSGSNQVSMAAHDVQSSYQNAGDQAKRDLSRRGVSSGSGAQLALASQYKQALATALSAAKTRARKSAIGDQASMLGNMTTAANQLISTGNSTLGTGASLAGAATSAQNAAAGVQNNIISALAQVGQLYAAAGSLQGNQSGALAGIANSNNSYLNTLRSAFGDVTSATANYGNFLGDIAGGFYSYAIQQQMSENSSAGGSFGGSSGAGNRSGGGVKITNSSGTPYSAWSDSEKSAFSRGF